MKRAPIVRGKSLKRGPSKLRRSRLRPVGKRGAEDREAIEKVRAVVLERAGHRCERCASAANAVGPLHLHHRKTRAQGGGHEAANLHCLCRICHRQIHDGASDAHRWIVTRGRATA